MANNSVSFHRVIKTSPEKLYRAFTDANALVAWLPPYGFVGLSHSYDAKPGGEYKMSFINFTTGNQHSWSGKYIELEPNKFLKYVERFDDPNLLGEMTTTVTITKVSVGTEIKITQEGIPEAIPADGCYLGWQDSLEKLIKLVEPEIPDA